MDDNLEKEQVSTETVETEETAEVTEGQSEPSEKENPEEATPAATLETKGFDYAALQQEYNENGDLTEATRAKLHEVGITDEIIDSFIADKKAVCEAAINELAQCVGGRENYNAIIEWAGENLSEEEKKAYNSVRDKDRLKSILKDLKEKMEEKEGVLPEYITGNGSKPTVSVYKSQAQMMAAIRDPRYAKDPAYREEVRVKIKASREAGVNLGI